MTTLVDVLAAALRSALTAVHPPSHTHTCLPRFVVVPAARRRGSPSTGDRNVSVRHILHTFRSDERLSEIRLGVAHPPPPPGVTGAASAREEGGRTAGAGTGIDGVPAGVGSARDVGDNGTRSGDRGAAAGWDGAPGERENGEGGRGCQGDRLHLEEGDRRGMQRDLMWRSRWIYRDRRAPALEADELQVEVRGRARR